MKNYGLIEGQRRGDWLGGSIPYEERNPSGDWTSYLPPGEWQRKNNVDTMACVTFSALNAIETQYKFLTGQHREFSDRFTAKMSGTTTQGNWQFRVTDSIRRDGLVDEIEWPSPTNFTWDEYYATPPIDVIDRARTILREWVVNYEWVDVTRESLIYHLKHAPLQVTIPGHAVLNFYSSAAVQRYFDSYEPWVKERQEPFVSAMKIVLAKNRMFELRQVPGSPEVWLVRDGKKTHIYNQGALLSIADFQSIKTITQAELDTIPDTGLDLATLVKE